MKKKRRNTNCQLISIQEVEGNRTTHCARSLFSNISIPSFFFFISSSTNSKYQYSCMSFAQILPGSFQVPSAFLQQTNETVRIGFGIIFFMGFSIFIYTKTHIQHTRHHLHHIPYAVHT